MSVCDQEQPKRHKSFNHAQVAQVQYTYLSDDTSLLKSKTFNMKEMFSTQENQWEKTTDDERVQLIFGNHFGLLSIRISCDCCSRVMWYQFFFTMNDGDSFLKYSLIPKYSSRISDGMYTNLPNSNKAFFEEDRDQIAFNYQNDEHVLQQLASAYYYLSVVATTTESTFKSIENTIKMRTMFRRLYFRCFRKAFEPENNQAQKLIQTTVTSLNENLRHLIEYHDEYRDLV